MSDRMLVVSLVGALTHIEKFPGEIFPASQYEFVGLSHEEFAAHDKNWHHRLKICVVEFTSSRYPDLDLGLFDLVLIIDYECINSDPAQYLIDVRDKLHNPNVFIIVSGYDGQYTIDKNYIYVLPFFLLNVAGSSLVTINPLQNHNKKFDVLLGMSKPHRDFVYRQIIDNNMIDDCYLNITTNRFHTDLRTIYRSKDLDWVEDSGITDHMGSVLDSYAYLNDQGPRISHIMPWNIYDRSLYSIVAETNWFNHLFLSEKTAKALLARRIFVLFGSAGTLEFMRGFGFKTFDEILDETYDQISDDQTRFQRAWQQVLALHDAEPYEMYHRCRLIVEHNHNHIKNRDYFMEPLKTWLYGVISQIR